MTLTTTVVQSRNCMMRMAMLVESVAKPEQFPVFLERPRAAARKAVASNSKAPQMRQPQMMTL